MKYLVVLLCFGFICSTQSYAQKINSDVMNGLQTYLVSNPKIKPIYDSHILKVNKMFSDKKIYNLENSKPFWRAYKFNKQLELWAYAPDSMRYILIKTYPICETVGDLGPKRRSGDFQIPEGVYSITEFNPNSKYHLSLRVNYPNQSDLYFNSKNPGGDIYIHGKCETVGCLPMTDSLIEEIFITNLIFNKLYNISEIPIHIFPARLTDKNFNKLKSDYFKDNFKMIEFWSDMKLIYEYFEKNRILPNVGISDKGRYFIYN
ncbi:MAG: hypothetical protein MUE53_00180 [Chitinophagales bacterium]|jgi:murein L,D-transpeptidase YafK|nr:hypothetical protein [Chitinophagales bacterium]